jgi:hypothetical protein
MNAAAAWRVSRHAASRLVEPAPRRLIWHRLDARVGVVAALACVVVAATASGEAVEACELSHPTAALVGPRTLYQTPIRHIRPATFLNPDMNNI